MLLRFVRKVNGTVFGVIMGAIDIVTLIVDSLFQTSKSSTQYTQADITYVRKENRKVISSFGCKKRKQTTTGQNRRPRPLGDPDADPANQDPTRPNDVSQRWNKYNRGDDDDDDDSNPRPKKPMGSFGEISKRGSCSTGG